MRVRGARFLLCLLAVAAAVLIAVALAGSSAPPHAAGQPQPSLTPEAQITIPGGRSLAPGEDVTFVQPPPTPTPTPVPGRFISIFGAGRFSPVPMHVRNDSPVRVFLSLGAPDFTVTAFDDVLVQLQTSYPSGFPPGGPPGLSFCGADTARGNVVRCRAALGVMDTPHTLEVAITTAPEDTTSQSATLAPGETVHWVDPTGDGAPDRLAPALSVADNAGRPLDVNWDGATLTSSTAAAVALKARVQALALPVDQWPPETVCAEPAGTPNALNCALTGLPQVDIQIESVPLAPQTLPPLDYRDRFGAGQLTITPNGPDVAPGGESVDVALATAGGTLSGGGVVRPDYGGQFAVDFRLSDASSATFLYTGELKPLGETFAGRGLFLGLASPHLVGAWQVGDPDAAEVMVYELSISPAVLNGQIPPPPPGLPLPMLADTLTAFDIATHMLNAVDPPLVGSAGQALTFASVGAQPLVPGAPSWSFDWGDGEVTHDQPSQYAMHTYRAPGVYTIVALFTDASGVQTFGATQVRIAPAS